MNNEIKEILFLLHNDRLTESGKRKLEDYITNLQQENERLKTKTKEQSLLLIDYQDMEQKSEDYKSRIEKAVEYINHLSKEPNVFGHYGIHNDCAKWLLNILNGRSDE